MRLSLCKTLLALSLGLIGSAARATPTDVPAGAHNRFTISTGALHKMTPDGNGGHTAVLAGTGYAGNGANINDPTAMGLVGHGPLPEGTYTIGAPVNKANTGPMSYPLTPTAGNNMMSRSGFFIHSGLIGEANTSPSVGPPGPRTASDGCVVCAIPVRADLYAHSITLHVVATPPAAPAQ